MWKVWRLSSNWPSPPALWRDVNCVGNSDWIQMSGFRTFINSMTFNDIMSSSQKAPRTVQPTVHQVCYMRILHWEQYQCSWEVLKGYFIPSWSSALTDFMWWRSQFVWVKVKVLSPKVHRSICPAAVGQSHTLTLHWVGWFGKGWLILINCQTLHYKCAGPVVPWWHSALRYLWPLEVLITIIT